MNATGLPGAALSNGPSSPSSGEKVSDTASSGNRTEMSLLSKRSAFRLSTPDHGRNLMAGVCPQQYKESRICSPTRPFAHQLTVENCVSGDTRVTLAEHRNIPARGLSTRRFRGWFQPFFISPHGYGFGSWGRDS